MTAPRPRRVVGAETRILQALAGGDTLQQLLARPGITDTDITAVVRKYGLRVDSDGDLVPRRTADATLWALTLGEHHHLRMVRTQAARARACLNALTTALSTERQVTRDRSRRAAEAAAARVWVATLRGMIGEADEAIRQLAAGNDLPEQAAS